MKNSSVRKVTKLGLDQSRKGHEFLASPQLLTGSKARNPFSYARTSPYLSYHAEDLHRHVQYSDNLNPEDSHPRTHRRQNL